MEKPVLKMSQISKSFNGIKVLDKVDFELRSGEVHALMGGNGAGKSTLMKILTGVYELDEGEITINGSRVTIKQPSDAKENGISMIFQEFSLIPTLTVAQNIFLSREPKNKFGLIDDQECLRLTEELLIELNVNIDPNTPVEQLGVGYWQMTEIAKALSQDTKILIMDEPTSSLTKNETEVLFQMINKLKDKGIAIIYISHRMDEIFRICERITILRDGKRVITAACSELSLESVIQHIVGGNLEHAFEWKDRNYQRNQEPILQVRDLVSGQRVNGVSFDLYRGEILGIAGLMGSGRSETVRALFGIDPIDGGEIVINGRQQSIKKPQDAIKAGIALVPEDRRMQGLILDHSLKDNTLLPILSSVKKGPFIDEQKANQIAQEFVQRLNIKTDSIFKTSRLLSGGNQQKIVLAKWLATSPDILILDEPTIGVDIGAKTEIIEIIRSLADSGKAIIVISSELPELLALSDRVIVLHGGKVTKEMYRREIRSEEALQHAIQGF
ncbi:sugar ABC transporter ATP-binding protein [Effusibacillus lacus]|uniref:Sugar ABC transporter ATP-binding protein n=1 Tax=Effusibacillus lacus TaxID=1348429 RepID=A0A292YU46_9BACL|nr:sugar ABC transporter ATP-binding protein [Effusibacillus lacus]TCS73774.1 monosaccharide ABC transporter ATP-binding protein (CUT2 family) [Effusibacillus lacus]GAX92015.1 sugar ABC transporter ATP-binding protein [Effusibacillus lacus]